MYLHVANYELCLHHRRPHFSVHEGPAVLELSSSPVPQPFNETAQQVFARISALRDSLDGPSVRCASHPLLSAASDSHATDCAWLHC